MEPMFKEKRVKLDAKDYTQLCKEIFEEAQYRCHLCSRMFGSRGPQSMGHIHHITYRSAGGSDVKDNLVAVCAKCHNALHEGKSRQARTRADLEMLR